MKYIKDDLDFIFIRAQDSDGHWNSLSLNQVTDEQFVDWTEKRFDVQIKDDISAKGKPWTPEQKIDFLNDMSKRIGKPCVAMIKRSVRKSVEKKLKK